MKCIQYYARPKDSGKKYVRVSDAKAAQEVAAGRALYAPKRLWKKHTRDVAGK